MSTMNIRLTMTTKCRACGAEIGFIKTVKGKTMPVNAEGVCFTPSRDRARTADAGVSRTAHDMEDETFVMPDGRIERGRRRANGSEIGFVSHFATCPAANEFRKGRHKGK